MSFLKNWWQGISRKGFFFFWKRDWPGDENLPHFNQWGKTATKEDCEKEIRDSLNKKKGAQ